MTRVHIFCEGQTEETFVRDVLAQHFCRLNIWVNAILLNTGSGKGGVTSYGKVRWQIEQKCKEDPSAWVTMLIDFYALPTDFPGVDSPGNDVFQKALGIMLAVEADINQPNFIANLVVHEFEALLFSVPQAFGSWFASDTITELESIRQAFDSPELIDDGWDTAPSKRILRVCDSYDKILHGSLIALDIGLDRIRQECSFFDGWVQRLESLSSGGTV